MGVTRLQSRTPDWEDRRPRRPEWGREDDISQDDDWPVGPKHGHDSRRGAFLRQREPGSSFSRAWALSRRSIRSTTDSQSPICSPWGGSSTGDGRESLAVEDLDELGIPLQQKAGKLSGGQRAQAALALALAKEPDLLLLDEPLASLDPLARRDFLSMLMDAVAARPHTVLLSSHIIGDLERVCDYLVVLGNGRLQIADEIERIKASHAGAHRRT